MIIKKIFKRLQHLETNRFKNFDNLLVFLFFFCFSICAALIFQKILLPLLMQSPQGLVQGDSVYFNEVATKLAEKIKLQGWSAWELFPGPGAAGNVSLLAALYVYFTPDISLVLPINAALHALSGLMIFLIAKTIWSGKKGKIVGLVASILFVVFPSALNWYAQIHKDGYVIAASLLILYAVVLADTEGFKVNLIKTVSLVVAGSILLIITKPYHLRILLIVFSMIFLLSFLFKAYFLSIKDTAYQFKGHFLILIILAASFVFAPKGGAQDSLYANWRPGVYVSYNQSSPNKDNKVNQVIITIPDYIKSWTWHDVEYLPNVIEKQFRTLAETRAGLIEYGYSVKAESLLDKEQVPDNIYKLILYFPRAIQIALLAPFPIDWGNKLSVTRLVSILEMTVLYIMFFGCLLGLRANNLKNTHSIIGFSLITLLIYGVTISNLGTLYRLRYLPEMLFALIGIAGWVSFFQRKNIKLFLDDSDRVLVNTESSVVESIEAVPEISVMTEQGTYRASSKKTLLRSGIALVAITLLCYLALLARDVLIAKEFGIGHALDAYTIASLVPMFLVAIISVPLGNAFISQYINVEYTKTKKQALSFANQIAFIYVLLASLIMVIFFMAADFVFTNVIRVSPSILQETWVMTSWMMMIFLLSGLVIIGNAVFNANEKFIIPAFGQFFVPIFAILGVLFFSKALGIRAAVLAMLVGQIVNFIFIQYKLKRMQSCFVLPDWRIDSELLRQFLAQYLPLIMVAIFSNIIAFQSMSVATSMPAGSVAALGLSNKVIVLIAGLLEIVLASIILPYFSKMLSAGHHELAQQKLSSMLLVGTVVSIPFCYLISIFAYQLIHLVFKGGVIQSQDIIFVSNIFSLSLLQIPFLVVNTLLLKFAIANKQSKNMMYATVVVIAINLLLTKILASYFGIAGISVAMAMSVMLSSIALLVIFLKLKQVFLLDLIFIFLNWLLFISLIVCSYYGSRSGAFSAMLAYLILLFAEWKVIFAGRSHSSALN